MTTEELVGKHCLPSSARGPCMSTQHLSYVLKRMQIVPCQLFTGLPGETRLAEECYLGHEGIYSYLPWQISNSSPDLKKKRRVMVRKITQARSL